MLLSSIKRRVISECIPQLTTPEYLAERTTNLHEDYNQSNEPIQLYVYPKNEIRQAIMSEQEYSDLLQQMKENTLLEYNNDLYAAQMEKLQEEEYYLNVQIEVQSNRLTMMKLQLDDIASKSRKQVQAQIQAYQKEKDKQNTQINVKHQLIVNQNKSPSLHYQSTMNFYIAPTGQKPILNGLPNGELSKKSSLQLSHRKYHSIHDSIKEEAKQQKKSINSISKEGRYNQKTEREGRYAIQLQSHRIKKSKEAKPKQISIQHEQPQQYSPYLSQLHNEIELANWQLKAMKKKLSVKFKPSLKYAYIDMKNRLQIMISTFWEMSGQQVSKSVSLKQIQFQ